MNTPAQYRMRGYQDGRTGRTPKLKNIHYRTGYNVGRAYRFRLGATI